MIWDVTEQQQKNATTTLEEDWKPDPSATSKEFWDVLRVSVIPINILDTYISVAPAIQGAGLQQFVYTLIKER